MELTWAEGYFNQELLHLPIIWVETCEQFVDTIIEKGMPEMVSFDNDLKMPLFSVHSANPIAAREIHNICKKDWENYQKMKVQNQEMVDFLDYQDELFELSNL